MLLALQHASADQDLNVVGAVVLVADDQCLYWKLATQRGVLKLGLLERTRLWERELAKTTLWDPNETVTGDWCWVLSESLWPQYADELEELLEEDGIDIEFIRLAGGDKASVSKVEHSMWGYRSMITTDWKKVTELRQGEDRRDGSIAGNPTADDARSSRVMWTCKHSRNDHTVRFIPSTYQERIDPGLSSTKIREIVAAGKTLSTDELEKELQGVALGPELLAKYIKMSYNQEQCRK
ncbi:hypothetical protein F5Y11DRAFT_363218 [Daldinia sp. FL1419]|nr:hypothetical protein F5Y11DRAFT_363218 [Daldinia sp. FL1419]